MHTPPFNMVLRVFLGSALLVGGAASLAAPKSPVSKRPVSKKPPVAASAKQVASLAKVLEYEALLGELGWSLTFKVPSPKTPRINSQAAYRAFERYLSVTSTASAPFQAEKARLRTLKPQVAKLLTEAFDRVGEESAPFFPTDNQSPVRLAQLPDGQALLVGWIVMNDVLNTQETTAQSRAAQIASKVGVPVLRRMHNSLKASAFSHLGCVVTYGSKDFSDEFGVSLKGEVLGLIVPQADLRKVAAGRITEDVLIQRCQAYVRDRDSRDLEKIQLSLQTR